MPDYVSKLIEIALLEVGYLEKKSNSELYDKTANAGSNNYTKYGAWYEGGCLQANPWCAMFVSWCAEQAGIPASIIPCHAYCPSGVAWFKSKGLWKAGTGYTPKKGDIIYFSSDGSTAAHIGIVYAVDGSYVFSIEGNTSGGSTLVANGGGVAKKSYTLGYGKILGYGVPAYGDSETPVGNVRYTVTTKSDPLNCRASASAAGIKMGQFAKGTIVTATKKSGDWLYVTDGRITGWASMDYLAESVPLAVSTLVGAGVISAPNYWIENYGKLQHLDMLLINLAGLSYKAAAGTSVVTAEQAISKLAEAGAIASPGYWAENCGKVQYLDQLLMNAANRL